MLREYSTSKDVKAILVGFEEIGLWKNPFFQGSPFPCAFFTFETEEGQTLRTENFKLFREPSDRSTIYKYVKALMGGRVNPDCLTDGVVDFDKLMGRGVILTLRDDNGFLKITDIKHENTST